MDTQVISDVRVDRISLVSDKHTPAVPIATNEYAIFKMFGAIEKEVDEESQENKPKFTLWKDIEKKLDDSIKALMQ